jgi:hypothetical protein
MYILLQGSLHHTALTTSVAESSELQALAAPRTTHYPLHTAHYSLLTTHYPLLATRYPPPTTHYTLLTTRYSLLTTHYSLLTTHYSLLTTRCSLLATSQTVEGGGEGGVYGLAVGTEALTQVCCMAHPKLYSASASASPSP